MIGPSPSVLNGRDAGGRFAAGNKCATGNPHAQRVAQLRTAMLRAVTADDLKAIIQALVAKAKQGDVAATRELLNRLVGKVATVHIDADDGQSPKFVESESIASANLDDPAVRAVFSVLDGKPNRKGAAVTSA